MLRLLCASLAGALMLSSGLAHADDAPAKGKRLFARGPEFLFHKIDADGDGVITLAEFKDALGKFPKLADKPEIIEKIFDKLDADGDGKITPDEFKKLEEIKEKFQELREKKKDDK